MHSRLSTVATLAIATSFAIATPSAARASDDACSLLTTAQVSAALGVTVQTGRALTPKSCIWRDANASSSKKVTLTLLTQNMYDIGKTPLTGTEKPTLSGVGDDAFYKYFAAPRYERIKVVELDVRKGDSRFSVGVYGLAVDDAKADAKTLAQEVLPKI
jgi:hypothetical protein